MMKTKQQKNEEERSVWGADLTLITGGSRSGKSAFAQQQAEQINAPRLFIATCPRIDPEMDERIHRHQQDREGLGWQTAEVPLRLAEELERTPAGTTVLIDCLTLWINNLMYEAEQQEQEISEDQISALAEELARAAHNHQGRVFLVTNEVGLGIVPDNPLVRRYRDLVGRCNQVIAAFADQVFLVSCGIPMRFK
ncbi:adenosylcobinamide kinase; adenosylcobinamide-phosphate guanylyltransferase [Candidatus Electrothrix aarhusensis]|uniref:Adenosylcobinamide kinase n=1 Tax=Candidatus Electrothrix aarhusensis TaxID=1859131 RepID=A0A3S3UAU7_9BACT|nr:adenosylcobinamide kinase; adenosylcobinamide-phosphate guanylyltransferase [Candidatus Electrothrix aarhusensis]